MWVGINASYGFGGFYGIKISRLNCLLEGKMSPGNANFRGRINTVHLLIEVACFEIKENNVCIIKAADLNRVVQGGNL